MLPEGFHWKQQAGRERMTEPAWLMLDKKAVGYVSADIHDRWYAVADRHLAPSEWKQAYSGTPERARRWLELWACREEHRLRIEPATELLPLPIAKAKSEKS